MKKQLPCHFSKDNNTRIAINEDKYSKYIIEKNILQEVYKLRNKMKWFSNIKKSTKHNKMLFNYPKTIFTLVKIKHSLRYNIRFLRIL